MVHSFYKAQTDDGNQGIVKLVRTKEQGSEGVIDLYQMEAVEVLHK